MHNDELRGLTAIYASFEQGDLAGATALLDPALVVDDGLSTARSTDPQGPDHLLAHLERMSESFDDFHVEAREVWRSENRILLELRIGGMGKSGAEQWGTVFHLHTVVDGLTRHLRVITGVDLKGALLAVDSVRAETGRELSP